MYRMAEATATTENAKQSPQDANPSAPLGMKALCVLFGLIGILLVLMGTLVLIGGGVSFGGLITVIGALELAMVYGLWTIESWGWTLAMVLFSISALTNLLNVFGVLNTAAGGSAGASMGFFLVAGILVYIYQQRDLYISPEVSD